MSADRDDLLEHYQRELAYLRGAGVEYARRYPKIAQRLELGPDGSADPHVERLIESFAFLSGRVQRAIEAEFPRFTAALFQILYPHLATPTPATAIARFEIDPAHVKLTAGRTVPRQTRLFAAADADLRCRFRTAADVTLWPITVAEAAFEATQAYEFLDRDPAAGLLRLRLRAHGVGFGQLRPPRLRFWLGGDPLHAARLLDLLVAQVDRVAALTPGGAAIVRPAADCLAHVGFDPEEALFPRPAGAHPAYLLLHEHFTAPDKLNFIEVALPPLPPDAGPALDLLFLLPEPPRPQPALGPDSFQLGCTPIVNLFSRQCEPIRVDHTRRSWKVVPDLRLERVTEVHSIERVDGIADGSAARAAYRPMFSIDHGWEAGPPPAFWMARIAPTDRPEAPGTDTWLEFVDPDLDPTLPGTETILVQALCTNRRLTEQVLPGAELQVEEPLPISRIVCATQPTKPRPPAGDGATAWRLVSHLSLNYLSLSEGPRALEALQELLRLYAPPRDAAAEAQIQGLRRLAARPATRRIGGGLAPAYARGLAVELELDERRFAGGSALKLAAVLERVFAMLVGVNSFTQTTVTSQQRAGAWKSWPPRLGDRALL